MSERAELPMDATALAATACAAFVDAVGASDELGRGAQVGRYVVLDKLGAGAMGVVYAAYDPDLDRKVAVKLLLPALDGSGDFNSDPRTRLLREAQALARLSHPNVVAVHDVGAVDRIVWIAMELVDGQTLTDWCKQRRRGWREVMDLMLRAGQGLAAAHAAGLIHRDFKPDNVMVGLDGRVRVMDLGLARREERTATLDDMAAADVRPALAALSLRVTHEGDFVGTPVYMAPEQLNGEEVHASADVFAFCVTFWEALFDERPFAGETLAALAADVRAGKIRAPRMPGKAPAWLRRIVERGLVVDVARRWPSMQVLLAALERGQRRAQRPVTIAVLLAVTVVAGGSWAWQRTVQAERVDRCEAAGASIESVWDDAARARVRQGMLATGVGYAATTADKLMPRLDFHAETWKRVRTETCLAASADPGGSAVVGAGLAERTTWCLDERRMALESLIDELARPDATMVQRAVNAAAALEPAGVCGDTSLLAQLPAPPTTDHEAVRAIQGELLRAANLQAAGRYDAGLALARGSLVQAEALAWPPLVAAARLRVGGLLARRGEPLTLVETTVESAYVEAAEAGASGVLADAAVELVSIVGERLARPDDGERWARLARVALRSLEPAPGLRTAALLANLAVVHRLAGEYDEALVLQGQALAIRERALDPDHPDVASSLNNLGNTHFMMAEFAQALALHQRALATRERSLGPDHPDVAASLSNLAGVYLRMNRYPEALALQRRALAIRERAFGPDHVEVARSLDGLAGAHHGMGEFTEVKPLYERALAILERSLGPDHPGLAATIGNLAIIEGSLGAPDRARALHERALVINEKAYGPEHPAVAESLHDLANLLMEGGDVAGGRRMHERALAIREHALGLAHPDVALSLQNLAALDIEVGAYAEAKVRGERALAIYEAAHGGDHPDLAHPLEQLAAVAIATRRPSDAITLAARALALYEAEDPRGVAAARVAFLLARALWDAPVTGGRDRIRSHELALRARDDLRAAENEEQALAELELWLAQNPGMSDTVNRE